MCPVAGAVSYQDDFGRGRTTGGYHPHSGNDVHAPIGRPIRAPFAGLAVAHIDNWFAGRSVGLVGAEGFVRNAHLSRFGHLGSVKAGDVIGYVGMTGDALSPHDHFEWHPWNVPVPLHVAPTGYARIPRCDRPDPVPEPGVQVGVVVTSISHRAHRGSGPSPLRAQGRTEPLRLRVGGTTPSSWKPGPSPRA